MEPTRQVAPLVTVHGWIRRGITAACSGEARTPCSRRALATDIALAAAATVAALAAAVARHHTAGQIDIQKAIDLGTYLPRHVPAGEPALTVPDLIAVAMTAAPLAVRRRYPLTAFWLIMAAIFAFSTDATLVTYVSLIIATYCAAAYSRFRWAAMASLLATAIIVTVVFTDTAPPLPQRLSGLAVLVPAVLVGNAARVWSRRARDSQTRMRRLAAEHEAATLRALEVERTRIASELHDVVTHNVSVMIVQAGAARQVLGTSPDEAREALLAVESSGRAAMTELRHLLGLLCPADLNAPDPGAPDLDPPDLDTPSLSPQPGLAQLGTLIDRVSAAGLPVTSHISGPPGELPAGLDLAAYRVVQEALTNVLRHAGQARTEVRVDYRPGELLIEVADDGPPGDGSPAADTSPAGSGGIGAGGASAGDVGAGRGLLGLRERLGLYGGEFDAGRRPGGGWRVRARIPVDVAGPGGPAPGTSENAGLTRLAPPDAGLTRLAPEDAGHVPAVRG